MWGAELSVLFEPVDNLRFNANVGYLRTRIGKGEQSIDPMNRTLGNPDYTVFKPWVQLPSNCVVPIHMAETWLQRTDGFQASWAVCQGVGGILGALGRRSEEHTSELQSLMRISYAVFGLKKKKE